MYDSFDNTYQATIGIDFLSKVRHIIPRIRVSTYFALFGGVFFLVHENGHLSFSTDYVP
jgi:hypothetical protein